MSKLTGLRRETPLDNQTARAAQTAGCIGTSEARRACRERKVLFGVRLSLTAFAIFDPFEGERGRDAHLSGRVAAALMENAPELLAHEPSIEKVDVLASTLP